MLKFRKNGVLRGVLKDEASEPEMVPSFSKDIKKTPIETSKIDGDTHLEIPPEVNSLEELDEEIKSEAIND